MSEATADAIERFLARERENETRFLAELVRTPTDNPPGDCSPAADEAARRLEDLGLIVERHPVPSDVVAALPQALA